MKTASPVEWWRDRSHEFGPYVMDCNLQADSDWNQVLANGREELQRILQLTGVTPKSDQSVLEIGCGMGRLTANLADHFGFVVGIDISPTLIQQARESNRRDNVVYETTDGQRIAPAARDQFDLAFSHEVFHYIEPTMLQRYFDDTFRRLVPGGRFVFECNCQPVTWKAQMTGIVRGILHRCGYAYWRGWPTDPGFKRQPHRVSQITSMVVQSGFVIERVIDGRLREVWFLARKP